MTVPFLLDIYITLKTSAELIVLTLCRLKLRDAMSLGFEMASAKTQLTVGGDGVSALHVAWAS